MVATKLRYAEGTYQGEVNELKTPEGEGTFEYRGDDEDGRMMYDGEWKENAAHGYGSMRWQNGDRYEGDWANGLRQGQGKFTYHNGDVFTGPYVGGNRHGQGELIKANGEERSENYKEGKL